MPSVWPPVFLLRRRNENTLFHANFASDFPQKHTYTATVGDRKFDIDQSEGNICIHISGNDSFCFVADAGGVWKLIKWTRRPYPPSQHRYGRDLGHLFMRMKHVYVYLLFSQHKINWTAVVINYTALQSHSHICHSRLPRFACECVSFYHFLLSHSRQFLARFCVLSAIRFTPPPVIVATMHQFQLTPSLGLLLTHSLTPPRSNNPTIRYCWTTHYSRITFVLIAILPTKRHTKPKHIWCIITNILERLVCRWRLMNGSKNALCNVYTRNRSERKKGERYRNCHTHTHTQPHCMQ